MPHLIRIQILDSAQQVAEAAALRIAAVIRSHERPVLGLATGSTPERTYQELARLHREEHLSFRNTRTFNLDEYSGLPGDHPQSYRHFMQTRLFEHIDIQPWNTRLLDGTAHIPQFECDAFEAQILAAGGVDLWLLGIGANGHIAFNEPGSTVDSRTRPVALTPSTIAANSDGRFFSDPAEVPRTALTAGIATIRNARRLLLLATGESKAMAIRDAIEGPFSANCPASLLQDHPACEFLLDRAAASLLRTVLPHG